MEERFDQVPEKAAADTTPATVPVPMAEAAPESAAAASAAENTSAENAAAPDMTATPQAAEGEQPTGGYRSAPNTGYQTGSYQSTGYQTPYQNTTYQNTAYRTTPAQQPEAGESDTLGIISLVLGILSLIGICCCGTSLLLGVPAIICAAVRKSKKGSFGGMAVAGLVTGIIGCVVGIGGLLMLGSLVEGMVSGIGYATGFMDDFLDEFYGFNYYIG